MIFLDFKTGKWQKPSRVYVNSIEDMPKERMGASMVYFDDRLWVYSGADPYGTGAVYSDFYSFNLTSGLWKRDSSFSELNNSSGNLLGQAVRIYNSNAVIFSGGCQIESQQCSFGVTKSILFGQPNAHFNDIAINADEFEGRMGHSVVQLGEAVLSFGGCSFGKQCTS